MNGILLDRAGNYNLVLDGEIKYSNYDINKVKWVAENEYKDFYVGFEGGYFIDRVRDDISNKEWGKIKGMLSQCLQHVNENEAVSLFHYLKKITTLIKQK